MQKILTHLWYDNNAEEAVELYTSLFPDSKITSVARLGPVSPDPSVDVSVFEFQLAGADYIAINAGPEFKFNESMSLYVTCDSQDEVDRYWYALIKDGGEEGQCGWLKDKFGLSWQIVPAVLSQYVRDSDPERSNRVMQAMFKMQKLDIEELTRAYEGGSTP